MIEFMQTEWYEFQTKGKISADNLAAVPDIYLKNEALEEDNRVLKEELVRMKAIAEYRIVKCNDICVGKQSRLGISCERSEIFIECTIVGLYKRRIN